MTMLGRDHLGERPGARHRAESEPVVNPGLAHGGMQILARVAQLAIPEPHAAPKAAPPTIVAWASPPGILPTHFSQV